MFAIIQAAGWPIYFLLLTSVIAVALIIERAAALRGNKIVPPGLLATVVADYRQHGVTDEALNIIDVNLAFLELSQLPSAESAKGQSLSRFVGRAGVDINVLMANLRDHGWVRNFSSIVRTLYGAQDDVEISAVSVREGLEAFHGFVIRATKRPSQTVIAARELPRTTEQLTELVGRVPLREIVRETTDVIEKMCIEAALNITSNNRASAAEVLGLSRQSLYTKLNRHGLGGADGDGELVS